MKAFYSIENKKWINDTVLRLPKHDLYFGTPENRPTSGIPIGDGDTGSLIWLEKDGIHININKCDLWQDAPPGVTWNDECYCSGHEEELTTVKHGGEIIIKLNSPMFEYLYQKKFTARLSLADALMTLDCETPFGSFNARAFSENGITVLSCKTSSTEADSPEIRLTRWGSRTLWRWYAMQKFAPETSLENTEALADENDLYITEELNPTKFCLALRLINNGKAFSSKRKNCHLATISLEEEKSHSFTLMWTIKIGENTEEAKKACKAALDEAERKGENLLYEEHKASWEAFWNRSYLTLDDDYLENIYYLYLYYMNSESRGAYPPHFTSGLWGFYHDYIPWNYYFHYNIQHMYAPLDTAGHGELGQNYYNLRKNGMEKNRAYAEIVKGKKGIFLHDVTDRYGRGAEYHYMNCSPGSQVAMQMWRHYRFTGDEEFLRETALPFMRESVIFYLDLLEKEDDGLYHLHGTSAYESNETADDVYTDFTMIRTLFPTYMPFAEKELKEKMEDALNNLPDTVYLPMLNPIDWDGKNISFGVGKGKAPFENAEVLAVAYKNGSPVRHGFGDPEYPPEIEAFPDVELCPLYPSGLIGLKDKGTRLYNALGNELLIHRTGEQTGHWNMLPIFLARMGMGGEVQKAARAMLSNFQGFPNGMNAEDGENGTLVRNELAFYNFDNIETHQKFLIRSDDYIHFDFETEPIIAMALQESLLQSHEGILRICPATDGTPTSFRLFAEGGFFVGAQISDTDFLITVDSIQGESCYIALPENITEKPIFAYIASNNGSFKKAQVDIIKKGIDTVLDFSDLQKGDTLLLASCAIEEITTEEVKQENQNLEMKRCGKAVLGSPRLMG